MVVEERSFQPWSGSAPCCEVRRSLTSCSSGSAAASTGCAPSPDERPRPPHLNSVLAPFATSGQRRGATGDGGCCYRGLQEAASSAISGNAGCYERRRRLLAGASTVLRAASTMTSSPLTRDLHANNLSDAFLTSSSLYLRRVSPGSLAAEELAGA
jgi:hypothetical protein